MAPPPTGSAPLPAPPWSDPGWRPAQGAGAAALGRVLARGSWVALQSRPERTVYRVETTLGTLFAKHYTPRGSRARLRDFWLRRKPQRAFSLAGRLAGAGVSTPDALALLARGRGLWREALLVNRWIGKTRNWSALLTGESGREPPPEAYHEHLCSLARLLGALHRLGLYHGDLSAGNLVFGREERGWQPYLVDLEDLRPGLTWRRRVKNLEELGRTVFDLRQITLRDRWEFLREYARTCGLGLPEVRRLWREGRAEQLRRSARHSEKHREGRE